MKSKYLALAIVGLGLWSCTDPKDPTIKIVTPANWADVAAGSVVLQVQTTDFSAGHIHVWLDVPDSNRVDANTKAQLTYPNLTVTLSIPDTGIHILAVEGARADHSDIAGMVDEVQFHVH